MNDVKKYVKTQSELAQNIPKIDTGTGEIVYGVSLTALKNNWFAKDGNPGHTSHGYNVNAWREFVLSHLELSVANQR